MSETYPLDVPNFHKVNFHMLIEILAFQHASLDVFLDRYAPGTADEIIREINALLPAKKEILLQALYTAFGKTPEI